MYPDRDALGNAPCSGYITARDQSMVESGVTEDGKNTATFFSFFFFNNTNKTETALSRGKRCRYYEESTL